MQEIPKIWKNMVRNIFYTIWQAKGLNIDTLTTDQHIQIRAFLRNEWQNICYQFDIWHRSKNVKKVGKTCKEKTFQRAAAVDQGHS